VSLVEQEQLTLPEHLTSLPVRFLLLDLLFYIYVLLIVVCPFVRFLLAIVLSVLLRYMDSDYPFGIFKFFKIILLARLRVTVVDSDNLDEYKCVLMLNLFAESYNKTQSGNVYLMKYVCKSQLFNTFILSYFSPLF
jgi:hypothetical protein